MCIMNNEACYRDFRNLTIQRLLSKEIYSGLPLRLKLMLKERTFPAGNPSFLKSVQFTRSRRVHLRETIQNPSRQPFPMQFTRLCAKKVVRFTLSPRTQISRKGGPFGAKVGLFSTKFALSNVNLHDPCRFNLDIENLWPFLSGVSWWNPFTLQYFTFPAAVVAFRAIAVTHQACEHFSDLPRTPCFFYYSETKASIVVWKVFGTIIGENCLAISYNIIYCNFPRKRDMYFIIYVAEL